MPDGGHESDPYVSRAECIQNVAHAAIIDVFGAAFTQTIRTQSEHDGLHAVDGTAKRARTSDVADDLFSLRGNASTRVGGAHERAHGVPKIERFLDDEAPDASARADDQYRHGGLRHSVFLPGRDSRTRL